MTSTGLTTNAVFCGISKSESPLSCYWPLHVFHLGPEAITTNSCFQRRGGPHKSRRPRTDVSAEKSPFTNANGGKSSRTTAVWVQSNQIPATFIGNRRGPKCGNFQVLSYRPFTSDRANRTLRPTCKETDSSLIKRRRTTRCSKAFLVRRQP